MANVFTRFYNWLTGNKPSPTISEPVQVTQPTVVQNTVTTVPTVPHPATELHLTVPGYRQHTRRTLSRNPRVYKGYHCIGGNWFDENSSPVFALDLIDVLNNFAVDTLGFVDPGPAVYLNATIDNGSYVTEPVELATSGLAEPVNIDFDASDAVNDSAAGFQIGSDSTPTYTAPEPSYSYTPEPTHYSTPDPSPSYSDSSSSSCDSGGGGGDC